MSVIVSIRASAEEKAAWIKAAGGGPRDLSGWVREAANTALRVDGRGRPVPEGSGKARPGKSKNAPPAVSAKKKKRALVESEAVRAPTADGVTPDGNPGDAASDSTSAPTPEPGLRDTSTSPSEGSSVGDEEEVGSGEGARSAAAERGSSGSRGTAKGQEGPRARPGQARAPRPRSAAAATPTKTRKEICPHRVPAGSYCRRCDG